MKYLLTSHQKEIKLFTSDIPLPKNLFNLELEIIIALAEKEKEYFSPYPHSYYSDSEVVIYCQKCNYLIKQNDRLQKFQFPSYLRLKLDNLTYINAQQQCNICRTTLLSISQGFIIFQFYYKVFYLSVIDNLINSIIDYKSQSSDKCKIEEEEEALNHIYKISNQNNIDFKISKQNKQENKEEGNEKKYNIFDIQYPSIEKSNEILSPQINTLRQPEQSTKIKIVNNTQHSIMNINQFIQVMFLSNEGDEKSQIFNLISNLKQKKYRMKRIEQFTQSPVISEQFIFHNCPIMEFELYEDDKIIPYREYFSKYSIHFFFIFIQYQRTDTMNKKVLDMIKKLYPLDRQRMAIIVTNWSGDIKQKIEVQQKFKHYCFKQIIFLPQKARKQEILKEVEQCLQNVNAIQQNFKNTVFEVNNNVYADELINRFGLNYQMSKLRNRDNQDNYLQDLEIEKKKRDEELLKEEILQMKQLQNQRLERKRNCGRKKKVETQNNQEIISKRIRKQTTRVVQKRIKR
ncbi:unnamed protein product [Paramecium sonneborni]|uniref:Uncharacterized protein n=1 Tax=Paramecium sonneborni TaxID=65129 RepID=A0A8S1REY4_9CILI|nr:unnamed protein product [Paramecium sonneborni]